VYAKLIIDFQTNNVVTTLTYVLRMKIST